MSLTSEIRDALRNAPGPITAKEVRESLDGEYTGDQVSKLLSAMTASGEVIRERTADGATYLLDPSFKPKRKAKDAPAPEAPATKSADVRPTKKKSEAAAKAATRKERSLSTVVAKLRDATPAPARATLQPADPAAAVMPRKTMRQLALAVVALHPDPMTPELKEAVMFAMHASL